MGFNVSFSKKDSDRFYLPGQEINLARGVVSQKIRASESDNVLLCRSRALLTMLVFIAAYAILALRVMYVCLGNGIVWDTAIVDEKSVSDDTLMVEEPVKRADILDRNGEIIATSLPTVLLQADTTILRHPENVAEKLCEIFPDMIYEDVLKRLNRRGRGILLRRNLSPAQQFQVNSLGVPGLEFIDCEKRIYPQNNLFAHILGKTDIDNKGISGLERYMNERLTSSTKPVQLSVDLGVQNTIREELVAGVEKYSADGAAAILLEANSGRVVSLVSVPDYNPNKSVKVGDRSMFNFATKAVYEAGSVLKVFNTALSLESGKIDVTDRFDTSKAISFGRYKVRDPHGSRKKLTPEDILVESSNIGSTLEVMEAGKEYQRHFLTEINLDKRFKNFELVETSLPSFLPEKKWSDLSSATISYGYGISVTPLHIVSGFAAVVNGGIYHEPTLIAGKKNIGKRIISEKNSEKMRELLRAVVMRGTGRGANVAGYQVFGKTGTANKIEKGKYNSKKSISTFVSGFPKSNPKYVLLVVFDNPKGIKETYMRTEAGWNAVPVTNKIITAVAPQLNVKADFDLDTQKSVVDAAYRQELMWAD